MTFKAAVIGYGARGQELARSVQEYVSGIHVTAVADPAAIRQEQARERGLLAFKSPEELFAKEKPDLVIIATNPSLHCEQVVMAAEYGCHILCEKPLAISPEESDRMIRAVKKAGVVAAVDFETIFSDAFGVLRVEISRNEFGDIVRFDATDKGRPPAYDIETCMPHFLHMLMRLLSSKPIEVFARIIVDGRKATLRDVVPIKDLYPQGRTHDIGMRADTIEASYLFDNGITARFFLARLDEEYVATAGKNSKPGSEFMHLIAYGTRGQVKFHNTSTGYVYRKSVPQDTLSVMDWERVYAPEKPDPKWSVPTARLIGDFGTAIRLGRQPRATIEDAAMVVDQTYGIYASHLAGRPVELPLKERKHPLR